MGKRSQIRDEIERAMPGLEEQKVADDSKVMTSHAGAQSLQALGPTVEQMAAHCFRAPLTLMKEGIPIEQDSGLVAKSAAQSLLGRNVSLQGGPKPAPKAGGRRWVWTRSKSDTRETAFPIDLR
jgi:hypothetical protein